jgi:hypothetical protein
MTVRFVFVGADSVPIFVISQGEREAERHKPVGHDTGILGIEVLEVEFLV